MRFFSWLANVSVRTLKAFVPSLAQPDDDFAAKWLEPHEFELYRVLDPRERDHACQVARAVLAESKDPKLIRAALLHDIGKTGTFNPILRILVHLHTPRTLAPEPEFKGLRGAWQRNLYHPKKGGAMIRAAGGCERVAQLVERHHEPDGDAEAELLRTVEMKF